MIDHTQIEHARSKSNRREASKVRLAVLLYTNADGTEKLTPFVIDNLKSPDVSKTLRYANIFHCQSEYLDGYNFFEYSIRKLDIKFKYENEKQFSFQTI